MSTKVGRNKEVTQIYYVAYSKPRIRCEFWIQAESKQEARSIGKREGAALQGYRFVGVS